MVFYLHSHWGLVLSRQSLSSPEVAFLPLLIVVCDSELLLSAIYRFPLHLDQRNSQAKESQWWRCASSQGQTDSKTFHVSGLWRCNKKILFLPSIVWHSEIANKWYFVSSLVGTWKVAFMVCIYHFMPFQINSSTWSCMKMTPLEQGEGLILCCNCHHLFLF